MKNTNPFLYSLSTNTLVDRWELTEGEGGPLSTDASGFFRRII